MSKFVEIQTSQTDVMLINLESIWYFEDRQVSVLNASVVYQGITMLILDSFEDIQRSLNTFLRLDIYNSNRVLVNPNTVQSVYRSPSVDACYIRFNELSENKLRLQQTYEEVRKELNVANAT